MSLPPPALLPLLQDHPKERFVGALLTAGVHAFPAEAIGASPRTAAIWACATHQRFWLCAWDEARERSWAVAVGRVDQVRSETGWKDILHVGPWQVPLRRADRKQVEHLLKRWREQQPDGDPYPLSLPLPAPPTPGARGATTLAEGLATTVPARSGERWLCSLDTDGTHTVTTFSGSATVPLVLAISNLRTVLVGMHPDGAPPFVHELPPGALPTRGRAWVVDQARLTPRASKELIELSDALISVEDPADRWGLAARHALIAGSPARAVQLAAEAWGLDQAAHVWPHLAQVALGLRQGPIAAAAAWRALEADPDLDPAAVAALWTREAPALARTLRGRLRWREVRVLASDPLDGLAAVPPAPELLPWPPKTPHETWATALALHGRHRLARAVWARGSAGVRKAMGDAVLADAAGADDAARSWRRAANAQHRTEEDPFRALAHATGLNETAADRWTWGAWAFAAGRVAEGQANWRRALALDPEATGLTDHPLPPEALLALARTAEAAGYAGIAVRALSRAVETAPRVEATRLELARVLEHVAQRPVEAAEVLTTLADALDDARLDAPTTPRWRLWTEAARLYARAGHPEEAREALREALAGDFLDVAAWDAVLEVGRVHIPKTTRDFWLHVRRLLAGERVPDGAPAPPVSTLDDATLDALHPGGAGWLDGLRRQLDAATPPPFDTLTRGLDRLAEARFDQAVDVLDRWSRALDLERPPAGHVFRGRGAWGIAAWPSEPPVLLVGAEHLREDDPRHLAEDELGFAMAAELVHLRCDHPVLSFDQDWLGTSRSVYGQVSGWAGTAETVFDLVTLLPGLDQVKKIQTVVKIAKGVFLARGTVDKALGLADPVSRWLGVTKDAGITGLSREGLSGTALQFRLQAERAALLLTGDLRAATRALLKTSTTSAGAVERLEAEGLAALLLDPEPAFTGEELVRLTALVEFAATRMPATSGGSPAPAAAR